MTGSSNARPVGIPAGLLCSGYVSIEAVGLMLGAGTDKGMD